jgi:hypothetical protein
MTDEEYKRLCEEAMATVDLSEVLGDGYLPLPGEDDANRGN